MLLYHKPGRETYFEYYEENDDPVWTIQPNYPNPPLYCTDNGLNWTFKSGNVASSDSFRLVCDDGRKAIVAV